MWTRRHHTDAGQDLVEFALILPLLLLLLLGIAEFALIIFSYDTIADAAREGARYGVIHPTDHAGICNQARRLTVGLNQAALRCPPPQYPGSHTIRVVIEYDYEWITGLIMEAATGEPTLTLHAAATMQIE